MRLRVFATVVTVLIAAASISAPYFRSFTRAAAVFSRMAQIQGPVTDALEWEREEVTVRMATIPSRHGALRTRVYVPAHIRRTVTLMAGVNMIGIEEPRLYGLAYELASVGVAVITPDTPDLKRFQITARTVDMIEDAAQWLSKQRDLAPTGHIGMIGISFSGGLSVVAAGRPSLHPIVDFVFSFGGHSNFPRVLRFLCTGLEPSLDPAKADVYRRPHDYGVVIILLDAAEYLVPAEQVAPLQTAILKYLLAGHWELIDKRLAKQTFDEALVLADALPEPSRTYMKMVNDRDVDRLGTLLWPLVKTHKPETALSPELSPAPVCPVFLLHGTDDIVIPSIETLHLERYLQGKTRVRALLSSLITHAELDQQQGLGDVWKIVSFFGSLLRQ